MPTLRVGYVSDDLLASIKARAASEAKDEPYDLAAIGRRLFYLYAKHGMDAIASVDHDGPVPTATETQR
jgi:hypothetical protein